ncbi:MAG: hypothetical protein SVP26_04000 [Chloroflexota bacterium]|nr:hypothetical protein [Chloroflexota bacterium]
MQKSRVVGALICVLVVVTGAAFVWGIVLRSYWAVAIPVVIGFLGMLALGFWIGWTMAVTKIEPPPEATEESSPASDSNA